MITRLYAASRLHTNLFQPSFKLKSKTRTGAKVAKRYHPPQPPAHRVLLLQEATKKTKSRIQQLADSDPVLLFEEIQTAQVELGSRVDQRKTSKPSQAVVIARRPKSAGEQLEIHRRPYRRTKPIPPRRRTLDPYQQQIQSWLELEPTLTGVHLLQRFQAHAPEAAFEGKHLRTIQRAVEKWRSDAVRSLIQQIQNAIKPLRSTNRPVTFP